MSSTSPDPPDYASANPRNANVTHAAIPVTLTSVKDSADQRHLTVTHGDPTLIGRASKSESKNLQPSPTNALFDCPVISREHAELKVNQWAPAGDQITITDKGSMHGTHVNGRKLERYKPMSLRSGDLLQFGTRVTRGQGMFKFLNTSLSADAETKRLATDTHDGVVVTFDRVIPDTQNSYTLAGSSPVNSRGGYHGQYISDESDRASEDAVSIISEISDNEDAHVGSSAKTTPEQPKSQPGSAEQPIDVESMPPPRRPTVINLDVDDHPYFGRVGTETQGKFKAIDLSDDDDDYAFNPKSPSLYSSRQNAQPNKFKVTDLIHNSIDKNADVLVPDSVSAARLLSPAEDEESVLDHNTGLTGLLNDGAETSSERDEDSEGSELNDEMEDWANEDEYENDDDDMEAADRLSDSDASDLNYCAVDATFEADEPNSYSAKKQVSPELGSTLPAKQAPPPASVLPKSSVTFNGGSSSYPTGPFKPAPQPYYDPVRASQPTKAPSLGSTTQFNPYVTYKPWPSASQPYRPYTYAAPTTSGPSGASVNPFTDVPRSSRWDIPPAPGSRGYTSVEPASTFGASGSFNYPTAQPYVYQPTIPYMQRLDGMQPYGFHHEWNDGPDLGGFKATSTPRGPGAMSKQAVGKLKVVEETSPTINKKIAVEDLLEVSTHAPKTVIKEVEEPTVLTVKKRKADEMLKDNWIVPAGSPPPETEAAVIDHVLDDAVGGQEPPARRKKAEEPTATKARRNVAGDMAKYAAAAAVGGVSTMAFLCSPLAERLLEWLA